MRAIEQEIEALLFSSEAPLGVEEIQSCLLKLYGEEQMPGEEKIEHILTSLMAKYESEEFAFSLVPIAGGYQFLTKPRYHEVVATLIAHRNKKKLSRSAMEILSIIAYKQPVTKAEIEEIRGVSSDYGIGKLLEKDLIEIKGRSDKPGKPMEYGTSQSFMDYFGINSVNDLPKLRDIPEEEVTSGEEIKE